MTTILITGFGDFPGAPINPTTALVARLARTARRRGVRCIAHVFATRYAAVDRELPALIAAHRPDAIVMFGLAGRRRRVSIETLRPQPHVDLFPDAGGAVPRRARDRARRARRRRAAARRLRGCSRRRARPASRRACRAMPGTYLCNYVYWRALEAAAEPDGPRLAVFVHVPRVGQKFRPRARAKRAGVHLRSSCVRVGEAIVAGRQPPLTANADEIGSARVRSRRANDQHSRSDMIVRQYRRAAMTIDRRTLLAGLAATATPSFAAAQCARRRPISAFGIDAATLGVRAGSPDDQTDALQRAIDQAAAARVAARARARRLPRRRPRAAGRRADHRHPRRDPAGRRPAAGRCSSRRRPISVTLARTRARRRRRAAARTARRSSR